MDFKDDYQQKEEAVSVNQNQEQQVQQNSYVEDQSEQGLEEAAWAAKVQGGKETPNQTGIPSKLKAKLEQESGFDLSKVKIHYNSDEPAKFGALAYTKGLNVYVGKGNEEHLEHELRHVIQQMKGEAKGTETINGEEVDTRDKMEDEADLKTTDTITDPIQELQEISPQKEVIQRKPSRIKTQVPIELKTPPTTFIPENRANWALIQAQIGVYENLGDEDIKTQTAALAKLKKLLNTIVTTQMEARKSLTVEENERMVLLTNLADIENIEIMASKGGLDVAEGDTSADPVMSKKVDIAGTQGGTFKQDTDIVDASQNKIDQAKEGKVSVIVDKWDDTDTTVKKGTHTHITKEEQARAGDNYQDIKSGYVPKDSITSIKRVDKKTDTKYQDQGTDLEHPLFPHPPTMQDVKQGKLGDCYLLAAMATIANRDPNHFTKHIKDHGNGKVTVQLYKDLNSPVNITINKSTVVSKGGWFGAGGGKDEYAEQSLWVQMYEKAYVAAGFYGSDGQLPIAQKSYGLIEGGSSAIALAHLTGKAATNTDIESTTGTIPADLQEIMLSEFKGKIDDLEFALLMTLMPTLQDMTSKVFVSEDLLEGILKKASHDFGEKDNPNIITLAKSTTDLFIEKVLEKKLLTGTLGSGKYTTKETDLFDIFKTKLDAGKMMTLSTKEKIFDDGEEYEKGKSGGEPMVKGLAGNHAYSLLDYAPKDHKEGDTLSVKLRNPWGAYGRKYVDSDTGETIDITSGKTWKGAERKADKSGEFWVDLADVMACCSSYDFV
jgi:hypothetical protein